jgi:phenylacetic acid degradation operon negative regulatory protein
MLEIEPGLSAPELVLSLLDSAPEPRLTAAGLVAAGELLGIDAGAVRVAVARLVKKGVLAPQARGVYRVGAGGGGLHRRVLAWHRVEAQLCSWRGSWIGVLTGHLPRADRAALRGRARALRLRGFAELVPGLALRPANLRLSLAELRAELTELGLDEGALVMGIDADGPGRPVDAQALWDVAGLEARYRANLTDLQQSAERLGQLDVRDAARQTLLLGRRVMRDILIDPLLPEGLVDTSLRRRMIDQMMAYDRLGKACWRAFYRALDG